MGLSNFPVSYVRSWLIFVKPNSRGANKSSVAAALFLLSLLRFPILPPFFLPLCFNHRLHEPNGLENHRQIFRLDSSILGKQEKRTKHSMPRSLSLSLRRRFFRCKRKERKGKEGRSDSGNTVLFIERWSTSETPEPISLVAPRMLVHV